MKKINIDAEKVKAELKKAEGELKFKYLELEAKLIQSQSALLLSESKSTNPLTSSCRPAIVYVMLIVFVSASIFLNVILDILSTSSQEPTLCNI